MRKLHLGNAKIIIPKSQRHLAFNAMLVSNLPYKKARNLSDGSIEIVISSSAKKAFEMTFKDNGIDFTFEKSNDAGSFFNKYRKRWGIFIGIFIIFVSIYTSSLFVWRIDISGNETISDEEILKTLESSGCTLGTFIPNIEYDKLHNKFLLESDNISWISVNIRGCVANVVVRERMNEGEKPENTYTNVVSKYDAQIIMIQLYDGEKVVSIGDTVKKGDLLISGIMDSQSQGVRYVHANGIVKGCVTKKISVNIPLKNVKKSHTGKTYKNRALKIFSKTINFSIKYRNYSNICDKIETRKKILLFGRIELPLELITTYCQEYEYVETIYTADQAIDIALSKLREELDSSLQDAELISKSITTDYDSDGVYIRCELSCIEDISQLVEFEVQ